MEEEQHQLNSFAVTHLLQHTLRSLCNIQENSQWVYAVFWRILPRNYPPPKWDLQGGMYDRTRANRRNWILVWEDGFCNFAASTTCEEAAGALNQDEVQVIKNLQPELFFKMSHEIYNFGEGIIGKVAADHSHKWVYNEPQEQEVNFLSSWTNPADSHPRTWEAQFQSGIKTIALIAVREGVVQLGSHSKVMEDLSYVVALRKKFAYLESIPGVFLPHPSSSGIPMTVQPAEHWHPYGIPPSSLPLPLPPQMDIYDHLSTTHITPSMSSLEALLSKLPEVGPSTMAGSGASNRYYDQRMQIAKEEVDEDAYGSSSMSYFVGNVGAAKPDDSSQEF